MFLSYEGEFALQQEFLELYQTLNLGAISEICLKLGVAACLGGIVGYDREMRLKNAGLKTNILICMGATVYTAISLQNLTNHTAQVADPNRVIAQIVSGVGFLGAGAIIQSRGSVKGMTTAATIWMMAAIGAVVGSGQLVTAILLTLMILAVLRFTTPIYALMDISSRAHLHHLEVITVGEANVKIDSILANYNTKGRTENFFLDKKRRKVLYSAEVIANSRDMKKLAESLRKIVQIEKISYYEAEQPQKSKRKKTANPELRQDQTKNAS